MVPGVPCVYARLPTSEPDVTGALVTHPAVMAAFVHALTVYSWPAGAFADDAVTLIDPALAP